MKQSYIIILVLLTLIAYSCKKDAPDTVVNDSRASMSATIDGTTWRAKNTEAVLSKTGLIINGVGKGIPAISFVVADTNPGTHLLNVETGNIAFLVDGFIQFTTFSDPYANGRIILSHIDMEDSLISGRFDFIGHSAYNDTYSSVTDGVFNNLPLRVDLQTLSDSLIVDIDGETFFATQVVAELNNNTLTITGTDEDNTQTVTIKFPYDLPTGIYQFTELGTVTGSYTTDSTWVSQIGSLNITKNQIANKHIEGTFEFDAKEFHTGNIKKLTNGVFSVDYF
jgi:hypothetical protein